MDKKRGRTWDGGYIRTDSRGRDVFYIRRRIDGKLYDLSTRASSSRAAHDQLRRFEADPEGYKPGGDLAGDLSLDTDLVAAFLTWSRDEKGNTDKWVRDQKRALGWWIRKLDGADLRRTGTDTLVDALDGQKARKQKIATLKAFCSWLIHERHKLETSDDPTAGLLVPQARPEQWVTVKTFTRDQFAACRAKLETPWSDCADVLAGSGWHCSELERFISHGTVERHPMKEGAWVLSCPRSKGGEPHRTEVVDEVAEAGRRLLDKRTFDYFDFRDALRAACKAADMEVGTVKPGSFRHSVATWAINSGADPASVAAFLGHKSPQTTRRFYATHAVPAKVPTLI
jgi:integrase